MTKTDLKIMQEHLFGYEWYLKTKSIHETREEEKLELIAEIQSVKECIRKIGELLKR